MKVVDYSVNLNATVRVKLNSRGIEILQKECDALNKIFSTKYVPQVDESGYYECQLWELMNKFGAEMYMGNRNPPFMNFDILKEKQ